MLLEGCGGYHLIDKKWNEDLRKELHVKNVIIEIKDYKIKWLEHVKKMENQEIPKILSLIILQVKETQEDHRREGMINF